MLLSVAFLQVLIEGVAGRGGTVAIDDLILSPGCVKEQGELMGRVPHPGPVWAAVPGAHGTVPKGLPTWSVCPSAHHRDHPGCSRANTHPGVLVSFSRGGDTPSFVSKCVTQTALTRPWVPFSWWQLG